MLILVKIFWLARRAPTALGAITVLREQVGSVVSSLDPVPGRGGELLARPA